MDQIIQHKNLAANWCEQSLAFQMANIGSEVSRALKNQDKPLRFQGAFDRALELFDLTITCYQTKPGILRELCRAREEFCDYFYNNTYVTDPIQLQKYYDLFATCKTL